MKLTSFSEKDLRNLFLSMAKIGNARDINFRKPVIPEAQGSPMDPIELPQELSRLRGYNIDLSWDYVGDPLVSKFVFYARTPVGAILDGSFTLLDTEFSLTRLTVLWNGISMPLKNVSKTTYSEFRDLIRSEGSSGFDDLLKFIKNHYKLNEAQEFKLRH